MRAGVAHAADAGDGADGTQQVGEQGTQLDVGVAPLAGDQREVASVAVDVLPEQRHLRDATRSEQLDLGHDLVERTADLAPTHGGDDAERTVVVAADLDRDPGVERAVATDGERGREHRVIVDHRLVEDLGDRAVLTGVGHQLGGPVDVVRAEHDVHVPGLALHELAVLLGEAAGDDDLATVSLALPRLQVAERAVELVVGVLADAARVEHDDVGLGLGCDRHQAVGLEQAGDALGVVFVHLAPEGAQHVRPRVCHTRRKAIGRHLTGSGDRRRQQATSGRGRWVLRLDR